MQTDRIEELRALRRKMDEKFAQRGPDKYIPYYKAKQAYKHAVEESTDALLDCAEALVEILRCPHGVDEATIPAGGIDVHPKQVVVSLSVGLVRLRRAQAAIAKLNGDDHE